MVLFASDTFNVNFCYDPEASGWIDKRGNFDDISSLTVFSKVTDVAYIVGSYT